MRFEGHKGGSERLANLEAIAVDPKADPCYRVFALTILSVATAAREEGCEVQVLARAEGEAAWDEAQALRLGDTIFDISLIKMMSRSGRAKASIEVMVERNDNWLRLTRLGSLISDDAPGWEDTTKRWKLDDQMMDEAPAFAQVIAQVIVECGMWHAQSLAGCMPKCDACSFQYSCTAAPKYLIRAT